MVINGTVLNLILSLKLIIDWLIDFGVVVAHFGFGPTCWKFDRNDLKRFGG